MARDDARNGPAPRRKCSWKQPGRPLSSDDEQEPSTHRRESRGMISRRQRLNAVKCVELEQYREDFRACKYAGLTTQRKLEMFGTNIMPIFVPLARGETLEMYEQRFTEWLWDAHREELDKIQADPNVFRERTHRIAFANANAHGDVKFDPDRTSYTPEKRKRERSRSRPRSRSRSRSASRDRKHSSSSRKREREDDTGSRHGPPSSRREDKREEEPSHSHSRSHHGPRNSTRDDQHVEKRPRESTSTTLTEATKLPRAIRICDYEESKSNPTSTEILKAHLACGCTQCLFAAMGKMDKKLGEIEAKHASEAGDQQVIDLT